MPYRLPWVTSVYRSNFVSALRWGKTNRLNHHTVFQFTYIPRKSLTKCAVVHGDKTFHGFSHKKERKASDTAPSTTQPPQSPEGWIEYTIKPGDTLWALAVKKFHVHVEALIRDNGVQDPRKLQPGQKIRIRRLSYPEKQEVVASWYGKNFHGRSMANGELYNMHAATIAHKDLPLGTRVELRNPVTGQKVKAVVTDRGPFVEGRDVDLSYGLARRLSLVEKGVDRLMMRVLG